MAGEVSTNRNFNWLLVIIVIAGLVLGVYFLYSSGIIIGNSCEALLERYEYGNSIEDYHITTETYYKMVEKGCDF